MDKCPFCGAKDSDLGFAEDAFDCGTTILGDDIDRKPECYETEIEIWKSIVREMLPFVRAGWAAFGNGGILPHDDKREEILNHRRIQAIIKEKP